MPRNGRLMHLRLVDVNPLRGSRHVVAYVEREACRCCAMADQRVGSAVLVPVAFGEHNSSAVDHDKVLLQTTRI